MSAHSGSGPEAPGWGPPAPAPAYVEPYRPMSTLGAWTAGMLVATAVGYAAGGLITLSVHGVDDYTTPSRLDQWTGGDVAITAVSFIAGLLAIAAAVLFIIWLYRAYRNLCPLGAAEPRRRAGWAIGSWFVPVLNLILPKLMANEVWRGSESETAQPAGARESIPAFHHGWWAAYVIASVLAVAAAVDGALSSESFSESTTSGGLSIASNLVYGLAGVLGALVVRRTSERQEARWRRLADSAPVGAGGG